MKELIGIVVGLFVMGFFVDNGATDWTVCWSYEPVALQVCVQDDRIFLNEFEFECPR